MGIRVEFNPDLALRHIKEYKVGRRKEAECIPHKLQEGETYPFLKKDQRLFWLHGEIPLLETKGDGKLSMPIASIVIQDVTHFLQDGETWSRGTYKVIEIFKDKRVHFNGFSKI